LRLVVFDMDGTLVDSGAEIARRVACAFAALGLPQPPEQAVRANVGLSLQIYMGALAETDDATLIGELVKAYRAETAKSPPGQMPLFEGAREALERLNARADTVLGVATGKGMVGLKRALAENDLDHFFSTLQTPDHNPSKPHPGMLHSAMQAIGISPADTVMVGDAVFDMEMAQAAGVRGIGVSWGLQPPEDLSRAGAVAILGSFADLDAVLEASYA
jgi:phosphoglycolate phosphatase